MPDKSGAFLKASKIITKYNANITRVSYNKAVDMHTLFIEVEADAPVLALISHKLSDIGYLKNAEKQIKVILVEFKLQDKTGAVFPVLEILSKYKINISYMSSQQNGTEYQYFKMGLLVEDLGAIKKILDEISAICDVRFLEYDSGEKILDNTIFYIDFASEMRGLLSLSRLQTNEFIVNSNLIMQMLDENNEPPQKIFNYIREFARSIVKYKDSSFNPRISKYKISENVTLHCIEPPCGSNTYILESSGKLMFIDSGFAVYLPEMTKLLRNIFCDFDNIEKSLYLTHADMDHCGLFDLFDKIHVNKTSYDNFVLEQNGLPDYREQNAKGAPYSRLSRIITGYHPPELDKLIVIDTSEINPDEILSPIADLAFDNLHFKVYEGRGGHIPGELVFICEDEKLIFTGDIFVNIKGFTKEQAEFNIIAPYLMTSVDIDPKKAAVTRNFVVEHIKKSDYMICPGHGEVICNFK
jgi:Zn-dependent hydrolases, including glyoxylases